LRRIQALVALAAPVVFAGAAALPAQPVPERYTFAATSAPGDALRVIQANALVEEMILTGELARVTVRPDRNLPGRVHEWFAQIHRGVPIHGAGLSRQSADGLPVSVFGTTFADVDIGVVPSLGSAAALGRMEALAGAEPATDEPPDLVILPTDLGELVLAWSAPMQDLHTWFIDADGGQPVHRQSHVYTESAVGFGLGITGAPQKVSAWNTGVGFQAWDRLRPAEIVTMDAKGELIDRFSLFFPTPAWQDAVAWDDDNEWTNASITDAHAHLGMTYDYLARVHNWAGIDGQDGRILAIANIDRYYNASYLSPPFGPQGSGLMSFGETSEGVPLVPVDVVAHEYQHGVTDGAMLARTGLPVIGRQGFVLGPSHLTVDGETIRCGDEHTFPAIPFLREEERHSYLCLDETGSVTTSRDGRLTLWMYDGGSIHEAYSDIVGTAVEFSVHPPGEGLSRADYLLGEDVEDTIRRIDSPRSLEIRPGFTLPDAIGQEFRFVTVHVRVGRLSFIRYTRWGTKGNRPFRLNSDGYNGVHWNSTILSHAFYLAIEGGTHGSGATVAGVGGANRHLVERAFLRGIIDLAPPSITLPLMGLLIRQAALDLYGTDATFVAVHEALTAVGL